MGRYLSLPLLLIAVLIQSTVIPYIRIRSGGPDLILMMVLSWTLLAGIEESVYWAVIGGILQDLTVGLPTGTSALIFLILSFFTDLIVGQVAYNNLIAPLVVLSVGTAVYQLMLALVLLIFGRGISLSFVLTNPLLPAVIYNVILILPLFRIMGWIFKASRPKRVTL